MALLVAPLLSASAPAPDAVPLLPGFGTPPTPHFSGYLNASKGEPGTFLHYWFAAAEGEWTKKPLVLWLNGGPGASSILGMLQEQGPLIINGEGGLMENPWAWTKIANLVVLESPAGVGYSYCAAGGACKNTDKSTAKAAAAAIADLYASKFPALRANAFYITGESYAGVYSPTLAQEIVDANARGEPAIKLTGMAVGDPCTDTPSQRDSMDMLWWAHKNGLVPDAEYDFLWNTCGMRAPSSLSAGAWLKGASEGRVRPAATSVERGHGRAALSRNCTLAYRKFLVSSSKGVSQSWDKAFINELSFFSPAAEFRFDIPGTYNYKTAAWMMRDDVKKALHVDKAPIKAWPGPADGWGYTSDYNACNDAPGKESMVDFYRRLAVALPGKIVVYNGDTDPCVSYEGTRTAIEKVGFEVAQPTRPWFFNYSATSEAVLAEKDLLFGPSLALRGGGAQFGGEIVDYEHGLSFATVHGSGHMVPTFRPRAALQLLAHVVNNDSFAPPLPADDALVQMDDDAFDAFLDKWVVEAKSATFVTA